jgi:hypothetical protein
MATERIKLTNNKKSATVKHQKREIATLLQVIIFTFVGRYIYMYIYIYIYIHTCIHTYIDIHIYVYICNPKDQKEEKAHMSR